MGESRRQIRPSSPDDGFINITQNSKSRLVISKCIDWYTHTDSIPFSIRFRAQGRAITKLVSIVETIKSKCIYMMGEHGGIVENGYCGETSPWVQETSLSSVTYERKRPNIDEQGQNKGEEGLGSVNDSLMDLPQETSDVIAEEGDDDDVSVDCSHKVTSALTRSQWRRKKRKERNCTGVGEEKVPFKSVLEIVLTLSHACRFEDLRLSRSI